MIETSKIVQSLCFILNEIKKADKLKLVKLLYLADKYHVIRYGRTITGDEYWAMDYGPVGSAAKDILSYDEEFLSSEYEYASRMLRKVDSYNFEAGIACDPIDLDMLSETDIEALRYIVKQYGKLKTQDLIELTHQYPEWAQYKDLFKNRTSKRERIETEELLSVIPGDPLAMPDEHMEESKEILTGKFD